jgi:hypothetical protein
MDNKWEWLHRFNTTQGLLVAVFGGPAVTGVIQAILAALSHPSLPWWGYLLVSALCSGAIIVVCIKARERVEQVKSQGNTASKLTIHSAVYGSGSVDDQDVSDRLQPLRADGLVISVDNNTLGCDPAPGKPKRISVEYSYGNLHRFSVSRPENSRLVVPEDFWMKGEYERLTVLLSEAERKLKWMETEDTKRFWQWIGVLRELASVAASLEARLDEVWHLWNNSGGDKFIYPLAASALPDEIKSWEHKQLLEFRILYREYLKNVQLHDPDFHSLLIESGFPCNHSYLAVKNNLSNHADSMRTEATLRIVAFLHEKVAL